MDIKYIPEIPDVMDKLNFRKGAALMRKWLKAAACQKPHYSTPSTDVVKMDWVLGYADANKAFLSIVNEARWFLPATRWYIYDQLERDKLLQKDRVTRRFGDFSLPVADLHKKHRVGDPARVNAEYYYGSIYSDLNDLVAALGAFSFYMTVSGTVRPVINPENATPMYPQYGHDVTIDKVGVYVYDSYDFNGRQILGEWTTPGSARQASERSPAAMRFGVAPAPATVGVSKIGNYGSQMVYNGDFRDYRKETGKGGDFEVYSDLKVITLAQPMTFNTDDLLTNYSRPSDDDD